MHLGKRGDTFFALGDLRLRPPARVQRAGLGRGRRGVAFMPIGGKARRVERFNYSVKHVSSYSVLSVREIDLRRLRRAGTPFGNPQTFLC